MDSAFKNLAIWIVAGLAIGLIGYFIYSVLAQPVAPPSVPANLTVTPPPAQNNTPPAQPQHNVGLIIIAAPSCDDCESASTLADQVVGYLNSSFNITVAPAREVASSTDEAKALIAKYNITQLPALLITGNITESSFVSQWSPAIGSVESDGTLVSRSLYPPYYDMASGKIRGLVQGIAIQPSDCDNCTDAEGYLTSLEDSLGVVLSDTTTLDGSDAEAQALIAKYNVTKLPTILLDSEITAYPFYTEQILPLGTYQDGWYVLREVRPPYVELPSNSVRGMVDVAYLKNSSCTDCLNMTEIGDSLEQMVGFSVKSTTEYEIGSADGAALAKKYNITKIPTVLYSPELSVYPQVGDWWASQNNTIESDGWFVFRSLDQLIQANQTYQNITIQ